MATKNKREQKILDAARDYAVAWQQYVADSCAEQHEAHREAAVRLRAAAIECYRQEAEHGRPRQSSKAAAE